MLASKSLTQIVLLIFIFLALSFAITACGPPDEPDLTGTLDCPSEAVAGEDLGDSIAVTVSNQGPWDAGEFNVDLLISSDTTIPVKFAPPSPSYGEDVLLEGGRERLAGLGPNSTQPVTLYGTNKIPADTPAGTHYLGLVVDPGKVVGEFNEDNNTASCEIEILDCPPTADIVDARIMEASGGTVGYARLLLHWTYDTGEPPGRLLITVHRLEGDEWHNVMPSEEPFEVPDPTVNESEVIIFRLFSGDYRLVFNAFDSCGRETEFTFEQTL